MADTCFILTVRFSFLYNLYSVFVFKLSPKREREKQDRCTAMSVWNVFKDRIAFQRYNCVACRKRVQRYNKFLNYQTFYKKIFKEISQENNRRLINTTLTHKKKSRKFKYIFTGYAQIAFTHNFYS